MLLLYFLFVYYPKPYRLLILISVLAMLSSCGMFSENYVKPQIETPKHWSNDQVFNNNRPNFSLASLKWWQSFHDEELNTLISQVLVNNNDINKARVNIETAEDLLQVVDSSWVPSLNVMAGNMTGNLQPLLNNQTVNFAALNASYSLNILKTIRTAKLAKLNIGLQKAILNGIRLKLIGQTATTYYDLIAMHDQLNLCQTEIADLNNLHEHQINQYKNGLISELEVAEGQEQLSELESKLPQIETNITRLQNVLQVLLNKNPGNFNIQKSLSGVDIKNVMPKDIPSRVLEERPDIIIAQYNLKIAAAKVGVSYSNLFPDFDLMLPFGVQNMSNLGVASYATSTFWLAFIQGSMPLLDRATYENINKAKSMNKKEAYAYIATVRSAFSDVDNSLAWQKNSAVTLDKVNMKKIATQKSYKLILNRYNLGEIGYIDTLNYKLQLDEAEDIYNQAKIMQINSLVNLYLVLGGGYMVQDKKVSS